MLNSKLTKEKHLYNNRPLSSFIEIINDITLVKGWRIVLIMNNIIYRYDKNKTITRG